MAPCFTTKDLSEAFRYEVLSMLKKEGKITDAVIENMMSWNHSGFHVHVGESIQPDDEQGLENLQCTEDDQVIKKILNHLGLWETNNHDPPPQNAMYIPEITYDDDYSQIPDVDYWLE